MNGILPVKKMNNLTKLNIKSFRICLYHYKDKTLNFLLITYKKWQLNNKLVINNLFKGLHTFLCNWCHRFQQVSCGSGQYSREIIGQIKPITANIVPYGHFTIVILGQVCYLIVSIPDPCTLTYFVEAVEWFIPSKTTKTKILCAMDRCNDQTACKEKT